MDNYQINHELNQYDQIEGIELNGLMPKVMEAIGKTTGTSETSVKWFGFEAKGSDAMEVVDIEDIMSPSEDGGGDGKKEPDYSGDNENDTAGEAIVDKLNNASGTTLEVSIPEGETLSSLNIPADVNVTPKITGELEDGAVITSNSPKSIYIANTSEEPVDVTINANNTVYLSGNYNDINLNGKSITNNGSGNYPVVSGDININEEVSASSITVAANFAGEDQSVNYDGTSNLTVTNWGEDADLEINAPNATVTVGGNFDTLEASVSDNTLILNSNFHANKLVVNKGNVLYKGVNINDFVDEIETEGTYGPVVNELKPNIANAGVYELSDDKTGGNLAFTVMASGKFEFRLNGHTYTNTRAGFGIVLVNRNNIQELTINGPGKLTTTADTYCIWNSNEQAVININGGDYEGFTHVVYCEKGTINVYGGTFKMLGENTDVDANGNYKFLVNCYDANFTGGTAHINIYGGKFYQFNPAEAYGEPGSPVSYVANGYHVVESVEDGVKVYEVVQD